MKRVSLTISFILLLCIHVHAQSEVDRGVIQDGTYIDHHFGFSFKYPKDWVVHGEATNERIREVGKEKIEKSGVSEASVEVAVRNTYHLLTVFRHPVGTPGITFNPGVLILAEKVAHAPGITNGKDYLLNVRTILLKSGYQVLLKDPMECRFAGSQFFQDNYAAEINGRHVVETMFATVEKGYALVFIFLAEDQTSLDEMTKTMDTFDRTAPVRKGVTTRSGSKPEHKPH